MHDCAVDTSVVAGRWARERSRGATATPGKTLDKPIDRSKQAADPVAATREPGRRLQAQSLAAERRWTSRWDWKQMALAVANCSSASGETLRQQRSKPLRARRPTRLLVKPAKWNWMCTPGVTAEVALAAFIDVLRDSEGKTEQREKPLSEP